MPASGAARRHIRLLSTAIAASAALAAVAAPSASAIDLVTCGGSELARYSPALSNAPQLITTTTTSQYQPCVNINNLLEFRTGIASGTTGPAERSCDELLGGRTGTRVIRWSTGTTSTFSFISTASTLVGSVRPVIQQGSIVDGEFRGKTAIGVVLLAQADLDACATDGLASISGVVTLRILL